MVRLPRIIWVSSFGDTQCLPSLINCAGLVPKTQSCTASPSGLSSGHTLEATLELYPRDPHILRLVGSERCPNCPGFHGGGSEGPRLCEG